ncbi:MAG: PDZ domain-containing protein [Longimicrobiales bacterium]
MKARDAKDREGLEGNAPKGREGDARVRWLLGAALSGALLAAGCATGARAAPQEPQLPEEVDRECVCLDPDEIDLEDRVDARGIRAQVRRFLREGEEARKLTRGALERVERRIERLREVGRLFGRRARLGVEIRLDQREEGDARGVRIDGVRPEGPAAEAGLEEEDVIVAVADRRLAEPLPDAGAEDGLDADRSLPAQRLRRLLADHEPGDTVAITYLRDGEEHTVSVELGSFGDVRGLSALRDLRRGNVDPPVRRLRRPGRPGGPGAPPPPRAWNRSRMMRGPGWGPLGGLRTQALGPELGRYFGTVEGVLVLDVPEETDLGLRPGDVVLAVGSREVEDEGDFRRIVRSYAQGEEIDLRIRREDQELTVTGIMP